MDYFKLSKRQAKVVVESICLIHFVKAKVCGTPLHEELYALAGDLYDFLDEGQPPALRAYLPKKKPRILTADKMFQWLKENRYRLEDFVDGGNWRSPDARPDFLFPMWPLCGGTDTGGYTWLPEWFEKEEER